jgi:hypothetical protein
VPQLNLCENNVSIIYLHRTKEPYAMAINCLGGYFVTIASAFKGPLKNVVL